MVAGAASSVETNVPLVFSRMITAGTVTVLLVYRSMKADVPCALPVQLMAYPRSWVTVDGAAEAGPARARPVAVRVAVRAVMLRSMAGSFRGFGPVGPSP